VLTSPTLSVQRISLWLAVFFGAVMLVAFVAFPGFFPPMSPRMSADQVAAFYRDHAAGIRFSMITFNFCGVMLMPLFMVIVYQMKRMATPTQVFAYSYLSAVVGGVTVFALADLFWLIAAFRPERDPSLVLLLNDLAWITFTAPVGMIVGQNLCLALGIFFDARAEPIFPRWLGVLSIAVALAIAPSAGAAVVTSGPLAWNGVVSFWLRISAYAVFLVVMFFAVRAAISQEERELRERPIEEREPAGVIQ
jgi:hypothetical protein